MADTIGTAYVQIEPSFEGVVPKIDKEFGGAGEGSGKSFAQGFGSVVGTVGKVMAGAAAAGSAAVAGMVKNAVSGFADYEQLVGGVETLFGSTYNSVEEYAKGLGLSMDFAAGTFEDYQNRQRRVLENADNAYKTSGLSANEYMETVTSFAAALNSSLGEYAWQSANYAEETVKDMSDNANKMGTSMESIKNAYMGFSKGNFTMLDNLKLGYGGTKEEMQRLLDKAEELDGLEIGSLDMNSFADVTYAIHVIQEDLGITGTTAKEAASTISGSLATMQASWSNLVTAMGTGDDNALVKAIDNFVESAETLGNNVMPVIERALEGVATLIERLAPEIAKAFPELVKKILPGLLQAGLEIIQALADGLLKAIPELMPAITDTMMSICDMLINLLPELIEVGFQIILELAMGIAQALPELIPTLVDTILTIVEYLIDNVDMLIDAAIAIITALAEGLIKALPRLIEKAPEIIMKLFEAIIRNVPKLLQAGVTLITTLVNGIAQGWYKLFQVGGDIIQKIKSGITSKLYEARQWGSDMIQNFINGITAKFSALVSSVKRVAQTVKSFLGFSEPEMGPLSNFHTYAPDMMKLYAEGIEDNIGVVKNALTDATAEVMGASFDMETIQNIQASADPVNISQDNDRLGRIEALLMQFIDNFKQDIYLDTGALVGGTVNAYNNALGQLAIQGAGR